ncbi:MAG: sialidase family protein [Chitinophagaceae bacterium]
MLVKLSNYLMIVFIVYGALSCKTTQQATAAGATLDSSIVFLPQEGVYASMRIPALVISKKGTLLTFCEARIHNASDWGEMDLVLRRSMDGGKTWGPYQVIGTRREGGPTGNPAPVVDNNGTIHLLFQRDYATAYYTRSTDDGNTWSEPTEITYAFEKFKTQYNWNVLATGPGHAIQLQNGRLLVPVWLANSKKLTPHRTHSPTCIATVYSDDGGNTWQGGVIAADSSADFKNPNENMAVQLDDGTVMLNVRTGSTVHRRAVLYSADGISNWSAPVYDTTLFDPVCMASIIKVPVSKDGKQHVLVFTNPDSRDIPKNPRRNLVAKLSYDQGKSWTVQKVIEPGAAGYSDLTVGPDGTIYCLYETNRGKDWNYGLMLKKFNLKWLKK